MGDDLRRVIEHLGPEVAVGVVILALVILGLRLNDLARDLEKRREESEATLARIEQNLGDVKRRLDDLEGRKLSAHRRAAVSAS